MSYFQAMSSYVTIPRRTHVNVHPYKKSTSSNCRTLSNIKGIYYNNVISLEARISSERKALLIYTCCGIDPSYIHKDYAILSWHIEKGYPVFTKSNEILKLLMISIHPMSALPKMVRNKILPSNFFLIFFFLIFIVVHYGKDRGI